MKTLLPQHKEILASKLAKVEKIPWLDWGGCGYVAKYTYSWLKDLGYKPRLVLLHDRKGNNSLDWEKNIVEHNHIMVVVGSYFIDSEGIRQSKGIKIDFCGREKAITPISFHYLERALTKKVWNDMFDRRYVKNIANVLK